MSQVSLKQRLKDKIDSVRNTWDTSRNPSTKALNKDQYARLAFQQLNLDINDPQDHSLLLFALSRVLHGGHPLKPPLFLNTLVLDAEAICKKHGLRGGKKEAVRRLKSDSAYRHKYEDYSVNTLLKYMAHATDRNKNPDYDELAKDRQRRVLYSRTQFAPSEVPKPKRKPEPVERATPRRARKPFFRRPARPTPSYPILRWVEGRLYVIVYRSM